MTYIVADMAKNVKPAITQINGKKPALTITKKLISLCMANIKKRLVTVATLPVILKRNNRENVMTATRMTTAIKADTARSAMIATCRHPGTRRSLITIKKPISRCVANIVKQPATSATRVNYIRTNQHLRTS